MPVRFAATGSSAAWPLALEPIRRLLVARVVRLLRVRERKIVFKGVDDQGHVLVGQIDFHAFDFIKAILSSYQVTCSTALEIASFT